MVEDDAEEYSEEELLAAEQAEELDPVNVAAGYGYPKPSSKESQFKFFRHILEMTDSSKVGNLGATELGQPKVPVRELQNIALYAEQMKLGNVAKFLRDEGQIILATSSSKKGFLPQLFVTQIKKDQKLKSPEPERNKLFGKKKQPGE